MLRQTGNGVVNYELPNVPETYVHRIGRTGRAGRSGVAISFCNFDELAYLKDIEKLTGKKVPVVEDHPWPMEILEASPKKQPGQRPPRAERGRFSDFGGHRQRPPAAPFWGARRRFSARPAWGAGEGPVQAGEASPTAATPARDG